MRKTLTKKQMVINNLETIKDLYYNQKLSFEKIAKMFGISNDTIDLVFKIYKLPKQHRGILIQKYTYNENYFEKIDTPDKAYFLGWCYSDGNNYTNEKYSRLSISIQEEDGYILEVFKKYLQSNHDIKSLKRRKPHHKDKKALNICSNKISQDLINLGCVPAKSLILQFPTFDQVPEHLMSHFLRGCFDGDGCAYVAKKLSVSSASFWGCSYFITGLQKFLQNKLNITGSIVKRGKILGFVVNGRKQAVELLNYLYKDSGDIKLIRKYEKYQTMFNYIPSYLNRTNRSSKYIYLDFHKKHKNYSIRITVNGKTHHLGRTKNEEEGALRANHFILENDLDRPLNIIPGLEFV